MSDAYGMLPYVERAEDPQALISVGAVCISLATVAVALRIYTKWRFVGRIRIDDWLMVWSLLLLGVYCSCVIVGGSLVAKPTDQPLQPSELALSINLLNQAEVFYIATVMFLKISIGLFFLQIVQDARTRAVIYTCVGTSTIFSIATLFFAIFQCGIYSDVWDFIAKRFSNQCVSDAAALGMTYTHGALTIITDWTFLILPFFILRNTLMIKREKIAIGAVLAFGSISGIAAIARLPYIKILAVPKNQIFDQIQNIAIWSAVEPAVGIIAGSLVTVRPLFRVMFPKASRVQADSPMEIPSLATIATTQFDPNDYPDRSMDNAKLEAYYDSFGSSRPMTPQSFTKDTEAGRRPSDATTLAESPAKLRAKMNPDFTFPSAAPVFAPQTLLHHHNEQGAQVLSSHQNLRQSIPHEPTKLNTSKPGKQQKQTFLLDQTIDEPSKDGESSFWSPLSWGNEKLPSPTPLLPSRPTTAEGQPYLRQLESRYQVIRPDSSQWKLRDWDARAVPISPPRTLPKQDVLDVSILPRAQPSKPRQSMLKKHLSSKQRVFPIRGKSTREPGLPLDMFFGDNTAADDDDSETTSTISRQQSGRTTFSGY